ncbi:hypothetical protein ACFQV2_20225 [Actinokineospora soli]|uniref:Uncharacterized protein n=1 Tax=Actinokineospora soli TaxID=1048753 RepID=A0ABW2TRT1_9PSEU
MGEGEFVPSDVAAGETRAGQIGFQIADGIEVTDFELCAPTAEEDSDPEKYPCTPVKAPDGLR